jgi:hypothetical protein
MLQSCNAAHIPGLQVYKIFPELGEVLDNLIANRHFWQDALLCELAAGGDGVPRTSEQRAEEEVRRGSYLQAFLTQKKGQRLHLPLGSILVVAQLLGGRPLCAGQGREAAPGLPGEVPRNTQQEEAAGWLPEQTSCR